MIKNDKIYIVEWEDAHVEDSWLPFSAVNEFVNAPMFIVTDVGWILHEDDKCLIMASSKNNSHQWGTLKKIPKGWIRKKTIIK